MASYLLNLLILADADSVAFALVSAAIIVAIGVFLLNVNRQYRNDPTGPDRISGDW